MRIEFDRKKNAALSLPIILLKIFLISTNFSTIAENFCPFLSLMDWRRKNSKKSSILIEI